MCNTELYKYLDLTLLTPCMFVAINYIGSYKAHPTFVESRLTGRKYIYSYPGPPIFGRPVPWKHCFNYINEIPNSFFVNSYKIS